MEDAILDDAILDMSGTLLVIVLLSLLITGIIGVFVAHAKNRSGGEGFVLGFLLGPFGLLIEALLPTRSPAPSPTFGEPPVTGVSYRNTLPEGVKYRSTDGKLIRECPFCAEEILAAATVCRFCNRDVEPISVDVPDRSPQRVDVADRGPQRGDADLLSTHDLFCKVCGKPVSAAEAVLINGRIYCGPHAAYSR